MLVIHGIWAYGALQVWAEDSARPALAPPRVGRPSRAPRPHPFAVAPGELADALARAGVGDLAAKAVDDELTLRLPSAADGPLGSPELVRPRAEDPAGTPAAGRIALAGWRVPVLVFEPAAAMTLLPALADLPAGGLPAGELAVDDLSAGDLSAANWAVDSASATLRRRIWRRATRRRPKRRQPIRRRGIWPSAGRSAI